MTPFSGSIELLAVVDFLMPGNPPLLFITAPTLPLV